mmetsp:Transcript_101997/g.263645  ORF Transcript_101997/g.263645 Transcript_101997/m.263645 type:complete len:234 (+) Transcript_101997:616-1317(+)
MSAFRWAASALLTSEPLLAVPTLMVAACETFSSNVCRISIRTLLMAGVSPLLDRSLHTCCNWSSSRAEDFGGLCCSCSCGGCGGGVGCCGCGAGTGGASWACSFAADAGFRFCIFMRFVICVFNVCASHACSNESPAGFSALVGETTAGCSFSSFKAWKRNAAASRAEETGGSCGRGSRASSGAGAVATGSKAAGGSRVTSFAARRLLAKAMNDAALTCDAWACSRDRLVGVE